MGPFVKESGAEVEGRAAAGRGSVEAGAEEAEAAPVWKKVWRDAGDDGTPGTETSGCWGTKGA